MADIKTGPDPARLPWIGSEPDAARGGMRAFAGWIAALLIVVVGVGFFLLGSRGESPVTPQQPDTTVPVDSSGPQVAAPSRSPRIARTQKPAAATSSNPRKPAAAIAPREQQTPVATVPRGKVAAAPAKPRPAHVAAKAEPKGAAVRVAAKTQPKPTAIADATKSKVEPKAAVQPIKTRTASATRPPTAVRPRSAASGPIVAAPDFRPPERFGGIAQVGAFTDKRQADLIWRDMLRANGALEQARVSLIQNRDWNGQPFYQFQVATASPQDSEVLCRSMQQINLRCEVVSFP